MNRYYKITNKTEKTVDIMIYGVIGDSWFDESVTAKKFIQDLASLENEYERINVKINSPGGVVWDGFAIFNALKNSKADIHTYIDGLAASMASVIALSGSTVHAYQNSLMMVHAASTCVCGNSKKLQDTITVLDKVNDSLITSIAARSEKSEADLKAQYFDGSDHWLSAQECKDLGFVDVIEDGKVKVPKDVKDMDYQNLLDQFEDIEPEEKKGIKTFIQSFIGPVLSHFQSNPLNQIEDMDPKMLRDVFGLDENATEDAILAHCRDMAAQNTTLSQERDQAVTDLQAANDERTTLTDRVSELETQVENLQNAAGDETTDTTAASDSDSVFEDADELSDADVQLYKSIKQ